MSGYFEHRYPEGSMKTRGHWGGVGIPPPRGLGATGMVRGEDREVWGNTKGVCQRYFLGCGEIRCAVSLSCPPRAGDLAKLGDSSSHRSLRQAP